MYDEVISLGVDFIPVSFNEVIPTNFERKTLFTGKLSMIYFYIIKSLCVYFFLLVKSKTSLLIKKRKKKAYNNYHYLTLFVVFESEKNKCWTRES